MLQVWLLAAVLGFGVLLILCVIVMITFVLCTFTSYNERSDSFYSSDSNDLEKYIL